MKLEYTLTLADCREAQTQENPPSKMTKPMSPIISLVCWILLFLIAVTCAVKGLPMEYPVKDHPAQNLFTAIAPSMAAITFLCSGLVMAASQNRRADSGRSAGRTLRVVAELLSALVFIWLIPIWIPVISIQWKPSDEQLIWVGVAPWLLYFGVVRYRAHRRLDRSWEAAWQRNKSVQCVNTVSIDQAGAAVIDEFKDSFIRWSYFKRYFETENLLVLKTVDEAPFIIPKRAVTSPQSMDQLKMLISDHIPEGKFKTSHSAFPVIVPGAAGEGVAGQ